MRKLVFGLIATLALALTACGGGGNNGSGSGSNTITMGNTDFGTPNQKVTIKVGDTVKLVDPATGGGSHYIATGENGAAQQEDGAPSDLNASPGVFFNMGDTKSFTFTKAGTYHITCTVHPAMNATIVVNP